VTLMDRQRCRRVTGLDYRSCPELAAFAAYCVGQLRGLHADHRAYLLYPGVVQCLPKSEIRVGQRDAKRWLADCEPHSDKEV
jgi:hypothetical protein